MTELRAAAFFETVPIPEAFLQSVAGQIVGKFVELAGSSAQDQVQQATLTKNVALIMGKVGAARVARLEETKFIGSPSWAHTFTLSVFTYPGKPVTMAREAQQQAVTEVSAMICSVAVNKTILVQVQFAKGKQVVANLNFESITTETWFEMLRRWTEVLVG